MPAETGAALRLGTRGGDLALWQAREAARLITAAHPGMTVDIRVIRTAGDKSPDVPIASVGGAGAFTREIEQALRDGNIDIAVHSLKDLPTRVPDDLAIAAVLERADPRDALVTVAGSRLATLPPRSRVGTSSARRRAQLLALRPDLVMLDVRGNVLTRLAKLDRGEFDALLLAAAGLQRLGLSHRVAEFLEPDLVMPAPGQGAIAVQARAADTAVRELAAAADHRATRLCTTAERACLACLHGGCQAPIGALATLSGGRMLIAATVTSANGDRVARDRLSGAVSTEAEAHAAGERLAELLVRQGADLLLRTTPPEGRKDAGPARRGR